MASLELSVDFLGSMMGSYQMGTAGFFMLTAPGGTIISHPDSSMKGKSIEEVSLTPQVIAAIQNQQTGDQIYESLGAPCHGNLSSAGASGWLVLSGLPVKGYCQIKGAVAN